MRNQTKETDLASSMNRPIKSGQPRRRLHVENLEPRLALAALVGANADTQAPEVRFVTPPAAGVYGTGSQLTFRLNFNEPVRVLGNKADLSIPVEVGYALRNAQYFSGSGTSSLAFRLTVTSNDVDSDGISLGRVNSQVVRDFDFAKGQLVDLAGNTASNKIPTVNTSRVRVDATGPIVTSYGNFISNGRQISLRVTFDGPVRVTGKPTIPVTIGGQNQVLAYAYGSGGTNLTFNVTLPKGSSLANPSFRGENGLPGEVILLSTNSDLKDRFGNSVAGIGSNFGETYSHQGNRVVLIGTHFEKLTTVTRSALNTVMNEEKTVFRADELSKIARGEADYWADYEAPDFQDVIHEVDVYRVAYRSTIPEQGNRPTIAYGLIAVPKGLTGALPLVSYQHGTLFLKESAPSQAFSWDKNNDVPIRYGLSPEILYATCFETRLNVAQFAGRGYALIAPDYFGIGNSIEYDSFVVKRSEQQACLDMHAASQKLFKHLDITTNRLFLNGWSEGALVSVSFQEALEAKGIKIDGVSTAATPADTGMFAKQFIFNPRPWSTTTTPNAAWSIFVHQFSSFALASYYGQTNAPLELFGKNYELSRKFYMREFKTMPEFKWQDNGKGMMEPVLIMDDVVTNVDVAGFLNPEVSKSARDYEKTAYASLIADVASGKTRLDSPMKMYYGDQDEGYAVPVCLIIDTWQRGTYGKTNIEQVKVRHASHRATFLDAAFGQLDWFEELRQGNSN